MIRSTGLKWLLFLSAVFVLKIKQTLIFGRVQRHSCFRLRLEKKLLLVFSVDVWLVCSTKHMCRGGGSVDWLFPVSAQSEREHPGWLRPSKHFSFGRNVQRKCSNLLIAGDLNRQNEKLTYRLQSSSQFYFLLCKQNFIVAYEMSLLLLFNSPSQIWALGDEFIKGHRFLFWDVYLHLYERSHVFEATSSKGSEDLKPRRRTWTGSRGGLWFTAARRHPSDASKQLMEVAKSIKRRINPHVSFTT